MKNHLISTAIALTMSVSIIHQANAGCWRKPYNGPVVCDTQEENQEIRDGLREYHEKISAEQAVRDEKYRKELKARIEAERRGETTRNQFVGKETIRTNSKFGADYENPNLNARHESIPKRRTHDDYVKDLYGRLGGIPWK